MRVDAFADPETGFNLTKALHVPDLLQKDEVIEYWMREGMLWKIDLIYDPTKVEQRHVFEPPDYLKEGDEEQDRQFQKILRCLSISIYLSHGSSRVPVAVNYNRLNM